MALRRPVSELLERARQQIERLDPEAARAEPDVILIDTRDAHDRLREGVIPGSIWTPRSVLEWRVDPTSEAPDPAIADPSLRLVLVCNDGYSSSLAAAGLKDMGFDRVADLIGGFRAWKAAGLPVVQPESP